MKTTICDDKIIYLIYETDEEEILLKQLIIIFNLKLLRQSSSGGCGGFEKQIEFEFYEYLNPILECINLVNNFTYYHLIDISKWYNKRYDHIPLTRDEKLDQIKSIIDNFIEIKNKFTLSIKYLNDYEYYSDKLKNYLNQNE